MRIDLTRMECKGDRHMYTAITPKCIDLTRMECKALQAK